MLAPRGGPCGLDVKVEPTEDYYGDPSSIYESPLGQQWRQIWRDGLNREDLGGQTPAPELVALSY